MKIINYHFLASDLTRYYAQYKNRVNVTTMLSAVRGRINRAEVKRLIDYFIHEGWLVPVSSLNHRWSEKVRQDDFNPDKIRDIFLNADIQSQFGRKKGVSSIPKAEPVVLPKQTILPEEDVKKEEVVIAPVEQEASPNPLQQYSTEELLQELSLRGYKVSLMFVGPII